MSQLMAFLELMKPRPLVMIVFTTAVSFLIAVPETIDWALLFRTSLGVALAGGGSLALNQYMERELDAGMARTRSRPLPAGRLSARAALLFGMSIMLIGYAYLWIAVNPLCSFVTIICGLSYLLWYTPLKLKSSMSSFVGAIPGGMLPVMGWAAARGRLEIGAWILSVILFLWQIPHALIISHRHRADYEAVAMKQLPIISTRLTTSRQMILNVIMLIPVTILPAFLNMTELTYPFVALLLGIIVFAYVIRYSMRGQERDAHSVFLALNFYLPALLLAMYLDKPS